MNNQETSFPARNQLSFSLGLPSERNASQIEKENYRKLISVENEQTRLWYMNEVTNGIYYIPIFLNSIFSLLNTNNYL